MATTKERVAVLQARVAAAAKTGDQAARDAVELLQLLYEQSKESLVDAVGDDMLRKQGEARQLKRLHRELTEPRTNRVSEGS